MHDFPIDMEDFDTLSLQHSPSLSSAFWHASGSVSSPSSADLTPTQITFTWSADDIPLVLYDEAYAQSPSLWEATLGASGSSADSGTRNPVTSEMNFTGSGLSLQSRDAAVQFQALSPHSRVDRVSSVPRSAASSFFDISSLHLRSSDSSATITSVGTFGQRKGSDDAVSHVAYGQEKEAVLVDEESVFRGQRTSAQRLTGLFARTGLAAAGNRFSLKVKTGNHHAESYSQTLSPTCSEISGSQEIVYIDDYEDEEAPETPTPMKPIAKSISWISSQNWDSQQYKEYIAREGLAHSPIPHSPNVDIGEDQRRLRKPSTPVQHKAPLENRDVNVMMETPRASHFARARATPESEREPPAQSYYQHHVKPTIQQDHYTWLTGITVQFLIDQEGFRSARPSFKFTGVARLRSAHGTKAPGALMAQFRPVTREAFHFHYAPFETPPVLRRVTVDFDEMHDYLTRQAHLTLKSNGVFVLHGHEMSSISREMEPVKLHWRFEYLVDDRRVEGTGRAIEGEKVLTPLTFSCTPAFALPSQGKRNTVMHVFKKGVAPKLVAEKMQPPGAAHSAYNKSSHAASPPTETHAPKSFYSKVQTWNLHKRGQSYSVRAHTEDGNHLRPHLPTPWTDHLTPRNRESESASPESPNIRRRRASSAGENQCVASFSPVMSSGDQHDVSVPEVNKQAVSPLRSHILPPTELNEMLDTPISPTVLSISCVTPPRSSVAFTPLTPRPRYSPHLREPSHTK